MENQEQFISSRRIALEIMRPTPEYSYRSLIKHRAQLSKMIDQWERQSLLSKIHPDNQGTR